MDEENYSSVEYSISDEDNVVSEQLFYDNVYLKWLLDHERDCDVVDYVEEHFPDESFSQRYQISLMRNYPFFGNKIIDNEEMYNEEKQSKFLQTILNTGNKEGSITLTEAAMGGGKTGFLGWSLDEVYKIKKKKISYAFVTKSPHPPKLPDFIDIEKDMDDVSNNSFAGVDEGAMDLSARRSSSEGNKVASDKLIQFRQRGIKMIFNVQNINMIDINVRRLTSVRILKWGIPFTTEKKKDTIFTLNKDLELIRNRLRPRNESETYMEIASKKIYCKFTHPLPKWWDKEKTSKYLRNWDMKADRQKRIEELKKAAEEEQKQKLEFIRQKAEITAEAYSKRGIKQVRHEESPIDSMP